MRFSRIFLALFTVFLILMISFYSQSNYVSGQKSFDFRSDIIHTNSNSGNVGPSGSRLNFHNYGMSFEISGIAQCNGIAKISKNISIQYTFEIYKFNSYNSTYMLCKNVSIPGNGNKFFMRFGYGPGAFRLQYSATFYLGNLSTNQTIEFQSNYKNTIGIAIVIPTANKLLFSSGLLLLASDIILFSAFNYDWFYKRKKK